MSTPELSVRDSVGLFAEQVAAHAPTPGGGAVAPAIGSLAASLGSMVLAYTLGKAKYAEHAPMHEAAAAVLVETRDALLEAADEDARAYAALNEAMGLHKDDPARSERVAAAASMAAAVPASVIKSCHDLLELLESLAGQTNRMLRSDLAIAAVLAEACCRASAWNVRINLPLMHVGPERDELAMLADSAAGRAREIGERIERACIH
ncbi:MAG: cyclodeaminase/cyclohydrolase family protein [Planctomycetota bacterium]